MMTNTEYTATRPEPQNADGRARRMSAQAIILRSRDEIRIRR